MTSNTRCSAYGRGCRRAYSHSGVLLRGTSVFQAFARSYSLVIQWAIVKGSLTGLPTADRLMGKPGTIQVLSNPNRPTAPGGARVALAVANV